MDNELLVFKADYKHHLHLTFNKELREVLQRNREGQ